MQEISYYIGRKADSVSVLCQSESLFPYFVPSIFDAVRALAPMQNDTPKRKKHAAGNRKTGRTVFDKSGRGPWEWQTATGVFEKEISDERLAELEASQLTLLDSPPTAPVASYYEWCESSKMTPAKPPEKTESQDPPHGAFVRLFKRLAKKA